MINFVLTIDNRNTRAAYAWRLMENFLVGAQLTAWGEELIF
jgi:hypothetical protein